jgi:hypothetical protein
MNTASAAAGASSRGGWLPFRVAIVIVVVGLLVVTCGSLIAYVLYRGEHSVELLKRAYLEQVADTAGREVLRLPATAAQVLALQGDTTLALPAPVRDLAVLHPPLEARVRLFLGKQIDRQTYAARLHRLGAGGGEIESDAPLAVFDALQVLLPTITGGDVSEILDGKVIALSEHEGARMALVRFTGIDWDTQARLEAFARRDRDTALPGPSRA